MDALRAVCGVLLGVVARLWLSTLRMQVEVVSELREHEDRSWTLAFFHGTQWPLLAWYRKSKHRPATVLVSLSADGAIQARALRMLGFSVVRGSSSRGGARGLAALVRDVKRRRGDAAFAVDGPKGPYGSVEPGALLAAAKTGGVVVPIGSAIASGMVFARAWDRYALAWPFSRIAVVLGAPLDATAKPDALGRAIADANARACALLASDKSRVIRSDGVSRCDLAPAPTASEK